MLKNVKPLFKNKKKPFFAAMLVLTILISGALAVLTDTDSAKNIFTVGNVDIKILEPNWVESDAQEIVPKQEIAKDPLIENTGKNNAYVYMGLWVPKLDGVKIITDELQDDSTYLKTENDFELFNYIINNGWNELTQYRSQDPEQSYNYYLYAYDTAVAPKTQSGSLFDKVVVKDLASGFETLLPEYSNIVVQGFAIQSDFYNNEATDAESAWTFFVNQNGFEWPNNPATNFISYYDADKNLLQRSSYNASSDTYVINQEPSVNEKDGEFLGWVSDNGVLYQNGDEITIDEIYLYNSDKECLNANLEFNELIRYKNKEENTEQVMLVPNYDSPFWPTDTLEYTNNPVECTTIIDRGGQSVSEYQHGVSEWFVYGLDTSMKLSYNMGNPSDYFTVQGDGYYEIELAPNIINDWFGTGSKIYVYNKNGTEDKSDDTLVEMFYVIIYGDTNGDSSVLAADVAIINHELLGATNYTNPASLSYSPSLKKVCDMNMDGIVDEMDLIIAQNNALETTLGLKILDQRTGIACYSEEIT